MSSQVTHDCFEESCYIRALPRHLLVANFMAVSSSHLWNALSSFTLLIHSVALKEPTLGSKNGITVSFTAILSCVETLIAGNWYKRVLICPSGSTSNSRTHRRHLSVDVDSRRGAPSWPILFLCVLSHYNSQHNTGLLLFHFSFRKFILFICLLYLHLVIINKPSRFWYVRR